MCGIAGFIDPKLNHGEAPALIEKMLEAIAHRGPDGRGKWQEDAVVFGHNRLSILDLSHEADQPMHYQDLVLIFNGEIYNYIELRNELKKLGYTFHSSGDTEVILAAYKAWGKNCVRRFVGMWAFAIWDKTRKELFCSRDRFGIKPFYYLNEGDRFYFGSEYKALKPSPLFSDDFNIQQIYRGLQLGWNAYHDETYFSKLKSLPAAHNLIYSDGKINISQYWDLSTVQHEQDYHEAVLKFRDLFTDSIDLHMRSDVEVGGCLSGGLDSSSIASVTGTNYSTTSFKTFTVYYEGKNEVDERPWVQEVIKKYPSLIPYYFTPGDKQIHESFDRMIKHADVPVAGSSPFSQYFVMQLAASEKIKVLLDGQGADETLGGYMHSFYRLIGGMFKNGNLAGGISELKAHASRQQFSGSQRAGLLVKSLFSGWRNEQQLYEAEYKYYLPFLPTEGNIPFQLKNPEGSSLNRFLYNMIFTTLLPTLLQFEDRNSMAFSIESRVPFLDHRLTEFVFSLPDSHKISKGVTKRILRDSMKGILPEAIENRKDKKGFVTPGEVKWLRGPLAFLLEQDFNNMDFINRKKASELLDQFKKGDNRNASLVWRLVVLRYWLG